MAPQEKLRDKLAERAGGEVVATTEKSKTIMQMLQDPGQIAQIEMALPNSMSAERFNRVCLTSIRANPTLAQCDAVSLIAACMQAAQLGLEPGVLGHSYLLPFWNNRQNRHDVQFIVGYKGIVDLAMRSDRLASIEAREVRENDDFDYQYGSDAFLRHKPVLVDRGEHIAYYGIAKFVNGGYYFLVEGVEAILEHRDRYVKSKDQQGNFFGPWVDDFPQMAKKTIIRMMQPFLPLTVQVAQAFAVDGAVPTTIMKDMADQAVIDVDSEEVAPPPDGGDEPPDEPPPSD